MSLRNKKKAMFFSREKSLKDDTYAGGVQMYAILAGEVGIYAKKLSNRANSWQ